MSPVQLSILQVCNTNQPLSYLCRFFETVTFQVCREKEAENEFYLESVVHLCTSITICFNPQTLYGVHKTVQILEK